MRTPCPLTWLVVALALAGCNQETPSATRLENIRVAGFGADSGGEFCSDFRLDADQAHIFFKAAAEVDVTTIHDKYDTLPCYVRGTGTWNGKQASWSIRAGGTAEVDTETSSVLLACSSCIELLGRNKN